MGMEMRGFPRLARIAAYLGNPGSGVFNSNPGVFVANTGSSIDFVPENASNNSKATLVTSSISPERLIQLSDGNLIATGYVTSGSAYSYHTYLVTFSGTT